MKEVHVAFVTDENYIQHTGVAMASVIRNHDPARGDLVFHIIGRPSVIQACESPYAQICLSEN